jgi:hypothetical protein
MCGELFEVFVGSLGPGERFWVVVAEDWAPLCSGSAALQTRNTSGSQHPADRSAAAHGGDLLCPDGFLTKAGAVEFMTGDFGHEPAVGGCDRRSGHSIDLTSDRRVDTYRVGELDDRPCGLDSFGYLVTGTPDGR